MDNAVLLQAGRRLEGWPRVMIVSHDRPDGDALGAMAAMKRIINAAGRSATAFVYDEVGPRYQFLDGLTGSPADSSTDSTPAEPEAQARVSSSKRSLVPSSIFTRWPAGDASGIDSQFDGILVVDTCSWGQLEPVAGFLRQSRLPKLVVDHHVTRDDLTGASPDVFYLVDPTSASASGLLHEWCVAMKWPVDEAAAEALFTGIATDTGWFRFSNTDGRTLRATAALLDAGVRADRMHARLMGAYSTARLRLMCEMFKTLQLHADGRVAVMWLTREMFDRCGAVSADTEDLVNEPMSAGNVIATVMLTDMGDGKIRVNLRSKAPEIAGQNVDMAAIAAELGGGGHQRAAGARVIGTLDEVRQQVMEMVTAVVKSENVRT